MSSVPVVDSLMDSSDRISGISRAVEPIARNVRRWRISRDMTLTALAERAGVAKSTVSLIERGRGNPSIDTIWALASALRVPFTSLFQDDGESDEVAVVREDDGSVIAVEQAGEKPDGLILRRMLTRTGGALIELYTCVIAEGAVRNEGAHVSGLFEHVMIVAGSVEISSESFCEVLREGDLISFRADRPHTYRVLDGPARLVSIHEYPQRVDD
jgi:XRE family transcriptional regulator, regulator of sulfur utilization